MGEGDAHDDVPDEGANQAERNCRENKDGLKQSTERNGEQGIECDDQDPPVPGGLILGLVVLLDRPGVAPVEDPSGSGHDLIDLGRCPLRDGDDVRALIN